MFILLTKVKDYFFNSHLKINSALSLLAFMPLFVASFSAATPTEGSVVNGVETTVHAFCDGKKVDIATRKSTLAEALENTDCALHGNDISNPAKETVLVGSDLSVLVMRAVPVTIDQDGKITIISSAYSDAQDILNQANIKIYPEDKVTPELVLSNFNENGLGQKINITRAPYYRIQVDGTDKEIRSWKKTTGEILSDIGTKISATDEVNYPLNSSVPKGATIVISRINEANAVEDQVIPYGNENRNDNNMYQGQTKVLSEGENGSKKVTYKLVYRNGALSEKNAIKEEVTKVPVNKVVVSGVKPYGNGDLWALILEASQKYNVDPGAMVRVMYCESGGRVNAVNAWGYKGLFQWDGSFHKWTSLAGVPDDYFNPRSQIFATAARVAATGGWRAWSCKP